MSKPRTNPTRGRPGLSKRPPSAASTRKVRGKKIRGTSRPEDDNYPTCPEAIRALYASHTMPRRIVEPFAGAGVLAAVIRNEFQGIVRATTLIDYGDPFNLGIKTGVDFLEQRASGIYRYDADAIVTNPPYYLIEQTNGELINMILDIGTPLVCLLMTVGFEESQARLERVFSRRAPTRIIKFSDRLTLIPNRLWMGSKDPEYDEGSVGFAWYIWRAPHTPPPSQLYWVNSRKHRKHDDLERYQVDSKFLSNQQRLL